MAEPVDPRRPKPAASPYLPRLWKAAPEPEEEPPVPTARQKRKEARAEAKASRSAKTSKVKKGKQKADVDDDDGAGATKLAETPALDTYEARQRARWIIGGVLGSIALLSLFLIVRAFRSGGDEPRDAPESHEARTAPDPKSGAENEARTLVEYARQADKAGKTGTAVDLLNKAAKNYGNTPSARLAMEALDRDRRKLPLFGVDRDELPTGPRPPKPNPVVALAPPSAPAAPNPGGATAPAPPLKEPDRPSPPPTAGEGARPDASGSAKALPVGFHPKPGAPVHPSGWPSRIVCDRDGAVMVLVPGATFIMGREDGEPAERPAHSVSLSTYYIDQHEVTVRQYGQFLRESGRPFDSPRKAPRDAAKLPDNPDLPVTSLDAREAREYCLWAKRRLPTEAQWELAARSPDGRVSYWNGEPPRPIPARGERALEPVMTLPIDVSAYGAFDLGGNAWEWTGDYFDSQYYQQVRRGVADPVGPSSSRIKPPQVTVKGGSKTGILTWREGVKIESRLANLGFRGVLPVEGPPAVPVAPPAPNNGVPPPGGDVPF